MVQCSQRHGGCFCACLIWWNQEVHISYFLGFPCEQVCCIIRHILAILDTFWAVYLLMVTVCWLKWEAIIFIWPLLS
jgi:hypothetical protein